MRHWAHHLETGNPEIDNHHQELFQLTAMLDEAVRFQSVEKIDGIIKFLEHYVVAHFQDEELLMKRADYAFYTHHKAEHEIFKVHVQELRNIYNNGISIAHLIFSIRKILDKLVYHVRTVDIGIADIVRAEQQ